MPERSTHSRPSMPLLASVSVKSRKEEPVGRSFASYSWTRARKPFGLTGTASLSVK